MEAIIIKRSPEAQREQGLGCLLIVAIPVIGFLMGMFRSTHTGDTVMYGIIAAVFLLAGSADLVVTMIPLKAAMIISDQGLTLSSSKGIYDSFAFWQRFMGKQEKLILWQNIKELKLVTRNVDFTASPTDGTGPTTYTTPQHYLYIEKKTTKEDVVFSIRGLDKTPDEILALCDQLLKKYGCVEEQ
ncbi:hypothetical protein AB6735_11420 [Mucilaginibacter sp. RCC_168]|uniref:hypothetical protein n=1 Tax=Mucilaginibacter sp. RCC_168 TaxID=3239221 RepID=UPI0035263D34